MKKLLILFILWSFPLHAFDALSLHRYDSSLQWRSGLENLIENILEHVLQALKPAPGRISSTFGLRRHPVKGVVRHHRGIDIACGHGSEIQAALPGVVTFAGWKGGYGRIVIIRHAGELNESRYAHLSKINVRKGQTVKKAQAIGLSGSSGLATGPHLHFELHREGKAVDPKQYITAATIQQRSSKPKHL